MRVPHRGLGGGESESAISVSQLRRGGKRVGWHTVERSGEAAGQDAKKDSVERSVSEVGFVFGRPAAISAR